MVAHALSERARKCREVVGYLAAFSSGHEALQAAIHYLDTAAAACDEAANDAMQANRRAREWAVNLVGGTGADKPTAASRPVRLPDTRNVLELLNKLPKRRADDKTRGFWVGKSSPTPDLISGNDEYQEEAKRLIAQLKLGPAPHNLVIASHVEIKFAMLMRKRGLTNESIVINNAPCPFPHGCQRYLADILPAGSKLTIHWPTGKQTYTGRDVQ